MPEMVELRNETMLEYLKRGLSMAYAIFGEVKEGTFKTLIDEIIAGKTYTVQFVNDSRINKGVPYVIVMMKESENWLDNWQYFVGKSVEV
jgi:hypothetical protein